MFRASFVAKRIDANAGRGLLSGPLGQADNFRSDKVAANETTENATVGVKKLDDRI